MNDELPKKKRSWIPIVIGVLVLFAFIGIGVITVAVSWFRQNLVTSDATEAAAMQQFDEVRAKYPGQQPLIRLVDGRPQYDEDRASQAPASTTPLTTLHVLAFDRDKGKVVTFSLPMWLLRMKSGPIRISAYQQGWDDRGVSFKIEDIEKHGPGIIVDASERREGRAIVWVD